MQPVRALGGLEATGQTHEQGFTEQGFQRAANDPKLNAFGDIVLKLMASAAELAETSDYR